MPNKIEAEQLLKDLIGLDVNNDKAFIMKVEENLMTVKKYIYSKTGE
jgi:hypothetical protein